jgi:CRP-like cAMP-binding protein
MALTVAPGRSQFLDSLPEQDLRILRPHLELVSLVAGDLLERPGTSPNYVVFPIKGVVSLEARSGRHALQIASVGRVGVVGAVPALCGGVSTHDAVVQFAGQAWCIGAETFAGRLAGSVELHRRLTGFVTDLIGEISLNALAAARATIAQRLARWLLTTADALESDTVHATHDLIAHSLGVRRPGVTMALNVLEEMQAVAARRACIRILRPARLRAASGSF